MAKGSVNVTDDEGTFLALLLRVERANAYQISKIYDESPVSNFGTSKGKIYPLIRRLKARGLLRSRKVKGRAGDAEELECTATGRKAVRSWVKQIKPSYLLLEDPLRTRVQSFDLLTREERLEWVVEAKAGMLAKLDELEAYRESVDVPFKDQVHDNAVSSVRSRMDWLDRLLFSIVKEE